MTKPLMLIMLILIVSGISATIWGFTETRSTADTIRLSLGAAYFLCSLGYVVEKYIHVINYKPMNKQKYVEKLIKQHIHLNDKVWSVGEYHAIQSSIIDATNSKNEIFDYGDAAKTWERIKFYNDVLQILNDKLNRHDT